METRAFLVDVYETLLTCDNTTHVQELPQMAGIEPEMWEHVASKLVTEVSDGRLSLTDAYDRMLVACGRESDPALVSRMLAHDQKALIAGARMFDDALPFLRQMRDRGIKVALVSNCAESTRPMLEHLGLTEQVDAVVLSCEVGASKPSREIYWHAVARLEVPLENAVLIDDQQEYCEGALAAGLGSAIHIVRAGSTGIPNRNRSINSLWDVAL